MKLNGQNLPPSNLLLRTLPKYLEWLLCCQTSHSRYTGSDLVLGKVSSHYLLHGLLEKLQSTQRANFIVRVPKSRTNDIQIGSNGVVSDRYVALTEKKEVFSKSSTAQLCPLIDDNGIMRARWRLSKEDFEFDTKHPIFLPSKHATMRLMMLKCHLDNYQQSVEWDTSYSKSSEYWASEMHYGTLNVAAFLAGYTVQMSRFHLLPIYLAKEWKSRIPIHLHWS